MSSKIQAPSVEHQVLGVLSLRLIGCDQRGTGYNDIDADPNALAVSAWATLTRTCHPAELVQATQNVVVALGVMFNRTFDITDGRFLFTELGIEIGETVYTQRIARRAIAVILAVLDGETDLTLWVESEDPTTIANTFYMAATTLANVSAVLHAVDGDQIGGEGRPDQVAPIRRTLNDTYETLRNLGTITSA